MDNLEYTGAYYLGALIAAKKIVEDYLKKPATGEDRVYRDAELRLITSDKHNIELYMQDCHDIMYRNHERDKNGKLIKCEAYFVF